MMKLKLAIILGLFLGIFFFFAMKAFSASFGNSATTGTDDSGSNDVFFAEKYTCPANCTLTGFSLYSYITTGSGNFKMALYTDNAGTPNALVAGSSGSGTISNGSIAYNNITGLSCSLTNGTVYWIAMAIDNANIHLQYDSSVGNGWTVTSQSYASFPPATAPGTGSTSAEYHMIANYSTGVTPILEQEGYEFFNDDGLESARTQLSGQDTDISQTTGTATRLRYLVNVTTGDPAGKTFQLEYKKTTDLPASYAAVPTSQLAIQTPTYVSVGTIAGTTSVLTAVMAGSLATNDILILPIISTGTLPSLSGWTLCPNQPVLYSGAGSMSGIGLSLYWCRYTGSDPNLTVGDLGDHTISRMIAVRGCIASGDPWDTTAFSSGAWISTSKYTTPVITTTGANEFVFTILCTSCDVSGTAMGSAQVNASLTSLDERIDNGNNSGNGSCMWVGTGEKLTAGTIEQSTVTVGGTYRGNWVAWTGALKYATPAYYPILVSSSPWISGSDENTTAQLAAPAGKTTSSFDAGKLTYKSNPQASIDIGDMRYTDIEWNLKAYHTASVNDIYQFRVTNSGTALDLYNTTAQWTISAYSSGSSCGGGTTTLVIFQ